MPNRDRHFSPVLFSFFKDLKENNTKEWFLANKDRYEDHVKEPAMAFIRDMAPWLAKISPHFVADPKRSLFRIHRDTRFAADKSPYKTHLGIQFRHATGKDAHAPGFYLHLEPGDVFAGLGLWHPDTQTATRIRDAIVGDPTAWKRSSQARRVRAVLSPGGDSLKRPPRGFDPNHPLVEDLLRKDFFMGRSFTQQAATQPGFLNEVAQSFRLGVPYMRFLSAALDLPF